MENDCCKHEMNPATCSFCKTSGEKLKPGGLRKSQIIDHTILASRMPGPYRPGIDPDERIAGLVAAGMMCADCLTSTEGHGCWCQRRTLYDEGLDQTTAWLHFAVDTSGLTPREAAGMAMAVQSRTGRVASLTAENGWSDRRTIMAEFAVKPQWSPARTQEADILPV